MKKTQAKKGKGITPKNNQANIKNANKGTKGTNKQYSKSQGNRGKQLNPNRKIHKGTKK
ncbi:hypothetical protein J7L48_06995 [bacterium]|nr:hypothetical protein [bacterium]